MRGKAYSAIEKRRRGTREGFTLVEVLIASTIMVVGLFGILTMAFTALKKADTPENVQQAIKLGQERLDYFRGQRNPYFAAGGTYFPAPTSRNAPDYNLMPAGNNLNIVFNNAPALFVREYLYGFDENRTGKEAGGLDGRERAALRRTSGANGQFAPNEIPVTPTQDNAATPVQFWGVVPNPDDNANFVAPAAGNPPSFAYIAAGFTSGPWKFTYAPRANDQIRANGMALDAGIKFVREVWIQTNNPAFGGPMCPVSGGGGPGAFDTSADAKLGNLGGLQSFKPAVQNFIPPYTMAVTVRVYERDFRTKQIVSADPGANADGSLRTRTAPEKTSLTGPGYNRSRPLVTMIGYYGLRRWLSGAAANDPQN